MVRHDTIPSPERKFWILCAFLLFIFLTGGSSWANAPTLIGLRPVSVLMLGYALATARRDALRHGAWLLVLAGLIVALTILHLIPLPPVLWQAMPGRGIVTELDSALELRAVWRPLSLAPDATWNALFFLAAPLAVLLLSLGLSQQDRLRLVYVVVALASLSALFGLIQVIGIPISLYPSPAPNAGLFANRNHQGVLLAAMLPTLMVCAHAGHLVRLAPNLAKLGSAALAIVLIPLIIITGSRAGMLIAVVAILSLPLLRIGLSRPSRQRRRRRLLPLIVGGVLLLALVSLVVVTSRDVAIARMDTIGDDIRYPVWVSVIEATRHYLPWGAGIGSYVPVYQIHEPAVLLRPTYSNHAHNDWLEVVLVAGVPGMLLLLIATILFLVAVPRQLISSGLEGVMARLGLITIFLFALASMADYPLRTPIAASILMIAATWALPTRTMRDESEQ